MERKPIFTEHGIIEVEPPSPFCVLKENPKINSKEDSNTLPIIEEDGCDRLRHNDYDLSCFNKKTKKRQYIRRIRRRIRNTIRRILD